MTIHPPSRWTEIEPLFAEALTLPSSERRGFVERSVSDPAVREEITRLLAAHDRAHGFLERLDPGQVADLIEGSTPIDLTIGRYEVLRRLGRGGMGVVYLARDPRLDRAVALKLLPALLGANRRARERFADEARAASALDHPHIGTIYEIDETPDGRPYIAMAYYEGGTLAQRLRTGALPVGEALTIATQIADALAASHARGIVHCDVKPANVVLANNGMAKVVDFGVAQMLGVGEPGRRAPGTPAYMSPEHLRGEIDARCDVWSFGITLYEMVAGCRPYRGTDAESLQEEIRAGALVPLDTIRPDVPAALAALVHECLAIDPELRPADGTALLDRLRGVAPDERAVVGNRARRRMVGMMAAAVLLVSTIAAGAVWLRSQGAVEGALGDPSKIAVMPLVSVAGDTALARLGRELVVTVSASLSGTGGLQAVEPTTILARSSLAEPALSSEKAAALAHSLSAGRMVHGTIVRSGGGVRLDLGVYTAATGAPLERLVLSVPTDDIAPLSDSIALALMRGSWSGIAAMPPSIGVLRTPSVPALRAYVEGEGAMARGRLRLAPQLFAQAVAHDSSFWFARWRHVYTSSWYGESLDSGMLAAVIAHRHEFSEADRLLIEAWLAGDAREALELRRDITRRFPDYWLGWFELANMLVHRAPYLGHSIAEAGPALERVIELNPAFVPAREHLMWVALAQRDTALVRRVLTELERVGLDSIAAAESGLLTLEFYRYLALLSRTGGVPDPEFTRIGVRDLSDQPGSMAPERFAADLSGHGFYRAQLALSQELRASRAPANVRAAHAWAEAIAHAGLGDWDDAVTAAAAFARESAEPRAAAWSYGLGAVGVWLGVLAPDEIVSLRELAARSAGRSRRHRPSWPGSTASSRWRDGTGARSLSIVRYSSGARRGPRGSSHARCAPSSSRSAARREQRRTRSRRSSGRWPPAGGSTAGPAIIRSRTPCTARPPAGGSSRGGMARKRSAWCGGMQQCYPAGCTRCRR